MSFFHPLGELFKDEDVRAVFLADEEGLFLPELEYLQLKSGQDPAESETNPNIEDTRDSPQDLPVVSRSEVEDYLISLYSKTGEPEVQADPEILSRFTLDRFDKKDFSLVYDPEKLKDLEKDPQEGTQSRRLVGLLYPYGIALQNERAGRRRSISPEETTSQLLGQTSVRLQIKDLSPWADKVLEKIERNWIIDPTQPQGINGTVGISVTITKSGNITSVEVIKSSGEQILDSSAVNAVKRSIPLPGLPIMYFSKSIVFTIEFEYDV